MSGFSQGGQIVHEAANTLTDDGEQAALDKVAAGKLPRNPEPAFGFELLYTEINSETQLTVLVFGDPKNGDPVGNIPAEKVKIICNEGDNICEGGVLILDAHNYQARAGEGAEFVAPLVQ